MTNSAMTAACAASAGREGAEGDDGEVDRVEHQLDGHQHRDGVAPGQEAEGADGEEQRRRGRGRRRASGSCASPPGSAASGSRPGPDRMARACRVTAGQEDAADDRRQQQHADDLEGEEVVAEQQQGDVPGALRDGLGTASGQRGADHVMMSSRPTSTTAASAAAHAWRWKTRRGRAGLGLGEHDREQDEHADGADVDEHLGGGHERRAQQGVDAGQAGERRAPATGPSG